MVCRVGSPSFPVPSHLFVQAAPDGREVAAVTAARKPTVGVLRSAWAARRQKGATPVPLVVFCPSPEATSGERVALCGPAGEQPVVHLDVEVSHAECLAEVAHREPSHHAATRLLLAALPELEPPFPGLRNSGLLATKGLTVGVPLRDDWHPRAPSPDVCSLSVVVGWSKAWATRSRRWRRTRRC